MNIFLASFLFIGAFQITDGGLQCILNRQGKCDRRSFYNVKIEIIAVRILPVLFGLQSWENGWKCNDEFETRIQDAILGFSYRWAKIIISSLSFHMMGVYSPLTCTAIIYILPPLTKKNCLIVGYMLTVQLTQSWGLKIKGFTGKGIHNFIKVRLDQICEREFCVIRWESTARFPT